MREQDLIQGEREPVPIPNMPNQTTYLSKPAMYPERFVVPDWQASWEASGEGYDPHYFVADSVLAAEGTWAEPEPDTEEELLAKPLNPYGRTGIAGRGLLGKWGANPAVDGIVTRYSEDGHLELLTITRGDDGEIALPGGFVDAGEAFEHAARRELLEETTMVVPDSAPRTIGLGVYISSSRNTDHAWVETNAFHWHLDGEAAQQVPVGADDAAEASWRRIDQQLSRKLLQTHSILLEETLRTIS